MHVTPITPVQLAATPAAQPAAPQATPTQAAPTAELALAAQQALEAVERDDNGLPPGCGWG